MQYKRISLVFANTMSILVDKYLSESILKIDMKEKNHRRCVSCRRLGLKTTFWRIVRIASNHKIELDAGMGRSAYLCPNIDCLTQAKSKNRLSSSLRTKVPDSIYQNLQERLSR